MVAKFVENLEISKWVGIAYRWVGLAYTTVFINIILTKLLGSLDLLYAKPL